MARLIGEIKRLDDLVREGSIDQALDVGTAILARLPKNVPLLTIMADLHWQKSNHEQAEQLVARGLEIAPDDAALHQRMGDIARFYKRIDAALLHYREAVRLDPTNLDGYFQYGLLLMRREHFTEAAAILQRALTIQPEMFEAHLLLASIFRHEGRLVLANVHARLHDHLQPEGARQYPQGETLDTYFLDTTEALTAARQGQLVRLGHGVTGQQICYHHDPLPAEGPETLIHLPMNRIPAFFFDTSLRPPATVAFDPADPQQAHMALAVARVLDRSATLRTQAIQTTVVTNKHHGPPPLGPAQKPRVFLFVSRSNRAGSAVAEQITAALRRQGCAVHLETEKNGLETLDAYHLLKAHYTCNPQVTISLDHANNRHLHPDVFNIIWYREPARELREGTAPTWRERDILLSTTPAIDALLHDRGARTVHRQEPCFDLTPFANVTPLPERRKVVFAGDAHHRYLHFLPREKVAPVAELLEEALERGMVVNETQLRALATEAGLPTAAVVELVYPFVVRHVTVTWLCAAARELNLELEVHGRFWDEVPAVAPFHRGEATDDATLATLYGQARCALAADPYTLHTRRLVTLVACGCTPILYDSRPLPTPSPWDTTALCFRTRNDLIAALSQEPCGDPAAMAHAFSYDTLARRILAWTTPPDAETSGARP
ncbi:MAG: tetratricopeptide repeat protein [Magnetococcales bacterium]|nr:tetratricopeptide repeat protein [Magnetococcales bacterium]